MSERLPKQRFHTILDDLDIQEKYDITIDIALPFFSNLLEEITMYSTPNLSERYIRRCIESAIDGLEKKPGLPDRLTQLVIEAIRKKTDTFEYTTIIEVIEYHSKVFQRYAHALLLAINTDE